MRRARRQEAIEKIVRARGQVRTSELARRFRVSDMTIRRDLEEMEEKGVARRVYGGAILTGGRLNRMEPPMLERVEDQSEAKRRIADAVAGMIRDGEKIFLGSGTTTLAVAKALDEYSNLTVVTNALTVINALAASDSPTVIVLGGFLRRTELSFIGHFAEQALGDLRVDKVIIGTRGIHPEHGLTSDHLQELRTDRAIMEVGDEVIIVADHTKFGLVAASRTAPVTRARKVVTDTQAPSEIVEAIRELGVEVIEV